MSAERSQQTLLSYKRAFGTVDGQAVIKDLMAAHHYNSTTVPFSRPIDPLALAMAEGERNVVLRILTILSTKEL